MDIKRSGGALRRYVWAAAIALLGAVPLKAQTLQEYTSVPNVEPGTSFLRLHGVGDEATFEIRAFGRTSREEYVSQRQSVTLSRNTARQLSPHELIDPSILRPEDTAVTLYIRSIEAGKDAVFQHVRYSASSGELENMSVCTFSNRWQDYTILNRFLLNVHTTRLAAAYSSYIGLSNNDEGARLAQLGIFDANSGDLLDIKRIEVPPLTTLTFAYRDIEAELGLTPSPDQYHVNVEIQTYRANDASEDSTELRNIVASHIVVNETTGTVTNLTQVCPIFAPPQTDGIKFGNPICYPPDLDDPGTAIVMEVNYSQECPQDNWPANTSTKGHLIPDSGADGIIEHPGDRDWWRVPLVKGKSYQIRVAGTPVTSNRPWLTTGPGTDSAPELFLRLYDTSGATILKDDTSSDVQFSAASLVYTATSTTMHFIEVGSADMTSTGGYQVQVADCDTFNDSTVCFPVCNVDPFDPQYESKNISELNLNLEGCVEDWPADTSTKGRLSSGAFPAHGFINPTGDRDYWRVTMEKDKTYGISVKGVIFATDVPWLTGAVGDVAARDLKNISLRLRDFSGQLMSGISTTTNINGAEVLTLTPTVTGTYFMDVGASDGTSTGGYMTMVGECSAVGCPQL